MPVTGQDIVEQVSSEIDPSGCDIFETADHAQDRGFPAAARTVENNEFTVLYGKTDIVYGYKTVWIGLCQVL